MIQSLNELTKPIDLIHEVSVLGYDCRVHLTARKVEGTAISYSIWAIYNIVNGSPVKMHNDWWRYEEARQLVRSYYDSHKGVLREMVIAEHRKQVRP